jgi:hypothetical protein
MSQPPRFALTSLVMPPRKPTPPSKGRQGGKPAARGASAGRKRLNKRKIVAFATLIILPLVIIGGVLGSIGSGSNSNPPASGNSAAPGIDLITQACIQMSTLADNAGALADTSTTVAGAATTVPGATTTVPAGPTTTIDTAAAANNLLAQMGQVAQLAANAAATNSAWLPMATDISKLNDMVQSDSGNDGAFSSQLDTVAQECSAVVGSGPSSTTGG